MIKQTEMTRELSTVFKYHQATLLAKVISNAYSELVKTSDFNELKEIVRDIAFEQKRLADSQKELVGSHKELTEAQTRTELKVEKLTEAQTRTELKVEELTEAQTRTELKVEELAKAQTRTELKVEELAEGQKLLVKAQTQTEKAVKQLAKHIGGLSDTIGGDVEDISYSVIPHVLEQELGWQIERLERVWRAWGEQAEEIDVFGQAVDPARPDET
ncbi:MAG TPA: hypothetical protein G4N96_13585, partial [Chloroflexi bacterium]|nr:hypothetical protein [Chloroflexota bacterium]